MPSAQASHPAYLRFTEPGFRGTFAIFAWFNDKAHVLINDVEGDDAMEVVWEVGALGHGQALSAEGHVRVMERIQSTHVQGSHWRLANDMAFRCLAVRITMSEDVDD